MSRKYKFHNNDKIYFITLTIVEWIDLFTRIEYKEIMLDSFKYCQKNKGLEIYSWCIMTSHIHMIIGSQGAPLESILRDLKSFTSRNIRKSIYDINESRSKWMLPLMEHSGQKKINTHSWKLWQYGNHPIELDSSKIIEQKLEYIHRNPVEEGIVEYPEHFLYSSARDYCGIKGLLEIVILE